MKRFLFLFAVFLVFLHEFAFANVVITGVMCDPVGSDSDGEWVRIQNTGLSDIDITGWKFNDGSNHILNIPPKNGGIGDMILSPGEIALLANKADKVSGYDTIIDTVMSLSNSGDTLRLINTEGAIVHSVTYMENDVVEGELCFEYVQASSTTETVNSNTPISGAAQQVSPTVNNAITYRTVEVEPPQDIYIRNIPPIRTFMGNETHINVEIYDSRGKSVNANCQISFGDGHASNVCSASHIYDFEGSYIVYIKASKFKLYDEFMVPVTVLKPDVSIHVNKSDKYVEVFNNSSIDMELNGWSVRASRKRFKIPDHTVVPANKSVKFGENTTGIDLSRYGDVVKIFDARNLLVASSDNFKNKDEEDTVIEHIDNDEPYGAVDTALSSVRDTVRESESVNEDLSIKVNQDAKVIGDVLSSNSLHNVNLNGISSISNQENVNNNENVIEDNRKIRTDLRVIGMYVKPKPDRPASSDTFDNVNDEFTKVTENISNVNMQDERYVAMANMATDKKIFEKLAKMFHDGEFSWLFGLLILVGFASIPLFMVGEVDYVSEKYEDNFSNEGNRKDNYDNMSEGFTIKEIK